MVAVEAPSATHSTTAVRGWSHDMCAWASLLAYGGAGHVGQETRDVSRVGTSLCMAHSLSHEARKHFMLAFLDRLNFGGEGAHDLLA